ncbi:MAG: CbiX/SirB N-terminal domain-containing protein [Limisphaerales bacterium]
MTSPCLADAAVLLVAHGSTVNADSAAAAALQARALRVRDLFAEVSVGFWRQEPGVRGVLDGLHHDLVFVVPLFVSEGYFTQEAIPAELGFAPGGMTGAARSRRRGHQTILYCGPVGTHPTMTGVLLDRAGEVVARNPFPKAPRRSELALMLAAHGTGLNANSRVAVEAHAAAIRRGAGYAEVRCVFMEEEPRIADWHRITAARQVVMVPFFISDGLHVREDIPVLLGEPAAVVQRRLAEGRRPWRNPTAREGRLLWYADAVGTDPMVGDVVLARIHEAARTIQS